MASSKKRPKQKHRKGLRRRARKTRPSELDSLSQEQIEEIYALAEDIVSINEEILDLVTGVDVNDVYSDVAFLLHERAAPTARIIEIVDPRSRWAGISVRNSDDFMKLSLAAKRPLFRLAVEYRKHPVDLSSAYVRSVPDFGTRNEIRIFAIESVAQVDDIFGVEASRIDALLTGTEWVESDSDDPDEIIMEASSRFREMANASRRQCIKELEKESQSRNERFDLDKIPEEELRGFYVLYSEAGYHFLDSVTCPSRKDIEKMAENFYT